MIFGKKVQWGWLYSGMYVQLSHFINPSRWEQYSLMALIRGLGLTFCFVSQTWLGIHKPQVFWRFHQNNTKDNSMAAFPTGKIWKIKTQTSYWFQIVKGPLLCMVVRVPLFDFQSISHLVFTGPSCPALVLHLFLAFLSNLHQFDECILQGIVNAFHLIWKTVVLTFLRGKHQNLFQCHCKWSL